MMSCTDKLRKRKIKFLLPEFELIFSQLILKGTLSISNSDSEFIVNKNEDMMARYSLTMNKWIKRKVSLKIKNEYNLKYRI
jgi:hypothetical protein